MDGAISTRKFPAYTTAQLESAVAAGRGTEAMREEIERRKSGESKATVIPQIMRLGGQVTSTPDTAFRFAIGTQYQTAGKHKRIATVIDQLTVTNAAGQIVKRYYKSHHEFMG